MKKFKKAVSLLIASSMVFSMAMLNVKAETTGPDFILDADNFNVGDQITVPDWLSENKTATIAVDESGEKYITNLDLDINEAPSTEFKIEATPISTNEYTFMYVFGTYDGVETRVWNEWYSDGNADNTVSSYTDTMTIDQNDIKLTETFSCSSIKSGDEPIVHQPFNQCTSARVVVDNACKVNEFKIWLNEKDDADAFTSAAKVTETPEEENFDTVADGEWGYSEDFESMYEGADPSSAYVRFDTKVAAASDGKKGVPLSYYKIAIDAIPEKEWEIEIDLNIPEDGQYTWAKLGYVDAAGESDDGGLNGQTGKAFNKGINTITLQGTVTEEIKTKLAGAKNIYVISAGGGTGALIDAIRISVDNKKLQYAPYYELDLNNYVSGMKMHDTSLVKFANKLTAVKGDANYINVPKGQTIDLSMCEKMMVVEFEVSDPASSAALLGNIYNAAGENLRNKNGHYLYTTLTNGKIRVVFDADKLIADANNAIDTSITDKTIAKYQIQFSGDIQLTALRIWYDREENYFTTWSYEEDFEGYNVGDDPSGTYISYGTNKVAETDGQKVVAYGSTAWVQAVPQKDWRVEVGVIGGSAGWIRIDTATTAGASMRAGAVLKMDYRELPSGLNKLVYSGDAADVDWTDASGFIIASGGGDKIDYIKVYVDGKPLNTVLSYEMDLTKYDNGESVKLPSWITSTGNVVVNGTEKYMDGIGKQIWIEAPETGMIIEADIEPSSDGATAAIHLQRGDADKKSTGNIKTYDSANAAVTKKYVINSSNLNGAAYIGLNLNSLKLKGLRIYKDSVAQEPAETWTATPYSYMSDFEAYEVGTYPSRDGMIKLTQSTVQADANGNKFMQYNKNTVAVEIDELPEKNVIISFDGRFRPNGGAKEQLQLAAANGTTYNQLVHHYDAYVEDADTSWHTYTYNIDMINKNITLFIDGVNKFNNSAWKAIDADVLAGSTKLICNFIQLDIDNLNVAVDAEKVYAGNYLANADGGKLTTVTANADVYGRVYGASFLRNDNNAAMIMALYEETDGVPKLVKCQSYDINANRAAQYVSSGAFNVGELEEGKTYMIKQFVWDSVDGMVPLTINSTVVEAQ